MTDSQNQFEFQGGDILLYNGRSWLSKAIRFFDGADVNHAALAIDATTLIEAAGQGLRSRPIADSLSGDNYTLVFRLPDQTDFAPVVKAGADFLTRGTPYAYQQLVLLALLSVTRRVDIKSAILRALVRTACDHAARLLNSLVDRGDTLMICSEFVYRCYMDGKDPRYHLDLRDGWRETFALAAGEQEETTVIEWAQARPEPQAPPRIAEAGAAEDPEAIVARAEIELDPLIAAYLVERSVVDSEVDLLTGEAPPPTLAAIPPLSDDELHLAVAEFRDSFAQARGTEKGMALAGIRDAWATVADFVTPGDLEHATPLRQEKKL